MCYVLHVVSNFILWGVSNAFMIRNKIIIFIPNSIRS